MKQIDNSNSNSSNFNGKEVNSSKSFFQTRTGKIVIAAEVLLVLGIFAFFTYGKANAEAAKSALEPQSSVVMSYNCTADVEVDLRFVDVTAHPRLEELATFERVAKLWAQKTLLLNSYLITGPEQAEFKIRVVLSENKEDSEYYNLKTFVSRSGKEELHGLYYYVGSFKLIGGRSLGRNIMTVLDRVPRCELLRKAGDSRPE